MSDINVVDVDVNVDDDYLSVMSIFYIPVVSYLNDAIYYICVFIVLLLYSVTCVRPGNYKSEHL